MSAGSLPLPAHLLFYLFRVDSDGQLRKSFISPPEPFVEQGQGKKGPLSLPDPVTGLFNPVPQLILLAHGYSSLSYAPWASQGAGGTFPLADIPLIPNTPSQVFP